MRPGLPVLLVWVLGCGQDGSPAESSSRLWSPPGPATLAIEAGLGAAESVWVLFESGEWRALDLGPGSAPEGFCWGTGGMCWGDGRIVEAAFAGPDRLLVSERTGASSWRVLDVDLTTGGVADLGPSEAAPAVAVSSDGAVAAIRVGGDLRLLVTDASGAFVTAAELPTTPWRSVYGWSLHLFSLTGARHLVVDEVTHVAEGPGGWAPAAFPAPVKGQVRGVAATADGARACVIAEAPWIVDGAAAFPVALPDPAAPLGRCSWSPDGGHAAFVSGFSGATTLHVVAPDGHVEASLPDLILSGATALGTFGTRGSEIVRVDWDALSVTAVVPAADRPFPGCGSGASGERGYLSLTLPRQGARALAVQSCGCIDCIEAGVYAVDLASGAVEPLLEPRTWGLLQTVALPDDTFLVAHGVDDPARAHQDPAWSDRLLRVHPDGATDELGPFAGLPTPIHGPVALP